jgi:hypothetical protein
MTARPRSSDWTNVVPRLPSKVALRALVEDGVVISPPVVTIQAGL